MYKNIKVWVLYCLYGIFGDLFFVKMHKIGKKQEYMKIGILFFSPLFQGFEFY